MGENLPIQLVVWYFVFSTFSYYQLLHLKDFRGASNGFELALTLSTMASFLSGLVFHVYYGWNTKWYLPFVLIGIGIALQAIWFLVEAVLGLRGLRLTLSLLGFVAWPMAAIFLFRSVPA